METNEREGGQTSDRGGVLKVIVEIFFTETTRVDEKKSKKLNGHRGHASDIKCADAAVTVIRHAALSKEPHKVSALRTGTAPLCGRQI